MRLEKTQALLNEKKISFTYNEVDGCGSIDFLHRGLSYHIWEYSDGGDPVGVETNLMHAGKSDEVEGNYEKTIGGWITQYF